MSTYALTFSIRRHSPTYMHPLPTCMTLQVASAHGLALRQAGPPRSLPLQFRRPWQPMALSWPLSASHRIYGPKITGTVLIGLLRRPPQALVRMTAPRRTLLGVPPAFFRLVSRYGESDLGCTHLTATCQALPQPSCIWMAAASARPWMRYSRWLAVSLHPTGGQAVAFAEQGPLHSPCSWKPPLKLPIYLQTQPQQTRTSEQAVFYFLDKPRTKPLKRQFSTLNKRN